MLRVVQQSLLGSILSNMLLVLGCAFLSGGIAFYGKEQSFNKVHCTAKIYQSLWSFSLVAATYIKKLLFFDGGFDQANAVVNSGLLLMAVMGLLFPAVLHYTHTELHYGKSELALSRFSSCIMLFAYACFLFFQLQSQKNLYSPVEEVGSCVRHFSFIPMLKAYSPYVDPLEAVSCYGHSFGVSKCSSFPIMTVSGWRSSKHRWWSSWDFEVGIHCLAWDYYCMDISPLRVSSRRHRGRRWHWSHVLDRKRTFISVWNMTQFAGSFQRMENADGVYQRNLASNCWKRCRACKRCNVCNEGQAGKSNKHRPFSYKL